MNINDERLFSLVRSALWNTTLSSNLFMDVREEDWKIIFKQASKQGLMGIAYDGLGKLDKELQCSASFYLQWAVNVNAMEKRYRKQYNVLEQLATFYAQYDIHILLLKGIGLSSYYPIPSHREGGDIDIFLFGDFEKGNRLMEGEGITVDQGKTINPIHSIFYFQGIPIENHQFFLSVQGVYKKNKLSESILMNHANITQCESLSIGKQHVFLPSPTFNAIYVSTHMITHMIGSGVSIRHLIDWAVFLDKFYDEIDFQKVYKVFEQVNLAVPLQAITFIALEYIGLSKKKAHPFPLPTEKIKQLVMERCILHPLYENKPNLNKPLKVLLFKILRLKEKYSINKKLVGNVFAFESIFYILSKRIRQPKIFFK